MPNVNTRGNDLIPMEHGLIFELNTFIAVDVEDPEVPTGEHVVRFVGTVVEGRVRESTLYLEDPDTHHVSDIGHDLIVAGWWAPMGYRP